MFSLTYLFISVVLFTTSWPQISQAAPQIQNLANTTTLAPQMGIDQIYQFEKGSYVENIAVRTNGNLLVTRLDKGEVYEIDPSKKKASLAHKFKGYNRVSGIIEIKPDVFAVCVGNLFLNLIPLSWTIWSIDMNI